jgi:hypothetical protein
VNPVEAFDATANYTEALLLARDDLARLPDDAGYDDVVDVLRAPYSALFDALNVQEEVQEERDDLAQQVKSLQEERDDFETERDDLEEERDALARGTTCGSASWRSRKSATADE